jgi:hypothetical protein
MLVYADVCWRMLTYADVWLQGIASPFDDQIAKDLGRTLPKHARYESPDARRALGISRLLEHTDLCSHRRTYTLGISRMLNLLQAVSSSIQTYAYTYADIC